jgi:hypothetical protein
MQITVKLIESIARNVFKSMFMPSIRNANVVTGDSIEHAKESSRVGDQTVGSSTKPIWLDNGKPKESDANVGDSSHPVYISGGVITPFINEIATKGDISDLNGDISDLNGDISDINDEIADIWQAIHDLQPSQ